MDFGKASDIPAPANPVISRFEKKSGIRADLRSQKLFIPNFLFLPLFKRFSSAVRNRILRSRSRYDLTSVRDKLVFFNKVLISQ